MNPFYHKFSTSDKIQTVYIIIRCVISKFNVWHCKRILNISDGKKKQNKTKIITCLQWYSVPMKGYWGEVYNCVFTDSPLVNLTDMMYNFRRDKEVGLNL